MHYPHMCNAGYVLVCTLSMWLLVIFLGDAYRTPLFSEQGVLDQGTGMTGMATAVDDKEVLVILCRMKSAVSHFIGDKKYLRVLTRSS